MEATGLFGETAPFDEIAGCGLEFPPPLWPHAERIKPMAKTIISFTQHLVTFTKAI